MQGGAIEASWEAGVLEALATGVVVVRTADDVVVYANAAAERLAGATRERLVGQRADVRFTSTEDDGAFELSLTRPDGSTAAWTGTARKTELARIGEAYVCQLGASSDDARARETAELAAFMSSCQDAVVSRWNDGRVGMWNPAAERLLGVPAADVVGKPAKILFTPEEPRGRDLLERLARGETLRFKHRHQRPDGTFVELDALFSPVRGEDGTVFGGAAVMRDVTEENARARALEESVEQNRVLLAEVHHRVKNNLQVVVSMLRLESARAAPDSDCRAVLDVMRTRVKAIGALHEMLYGKSDRGRVDLGAYAAEVARNAVSASSLERLPDLVLALEPVAVPFDTAVPFGLVLNELVTNAVKHAGSAREGSATLHVRVRREAGGIVLSVEDDGPERPPEATSSTGIGLSLVKSLTRQLRGRFELARGALGSTATLWFPVVEAAATSVAAEVSS